MNIRRLLELGRSNRLGRSTQDRIKHPDRAFSAFHAESRTLITSFVAERPAG
jgi:hypothetical protein